MSGLNTGGHDGFSKLLPCDIQLSIRRLLTDMKITSEADALKVMQCLHEKGPKTVVLSSTNLGSEGVLVALASTIKGHTYSSYLGTLFVHLFVCSCLDGDH